MSEDRQAAFAAWFAAQTHPEHTVPGYEHALFMRWTMGRELPLRAGGDAAIPEETGHLPAPPDPGTPQDVMPATPEADVDPETASANPPPDTGPAVTAPEPPQAPPEPSDAPTPAPAPLELFAWRGAAVERAFPLGSLDPPPKPPPPPPPPKPKLRRERGERWLPELHPDPATLPVDRLDVFTDGSGWLDDGTAQPAGIGVVLLWGDIVVAEVGDPIGVGTNIVAELRAIRRGLHVAATLFPGVPVTLYSDSEWSLKACVPSCEWSIREHALERLVKAIRAQFEAASGGVTFVHCKGHRGLKDAVGNPSEERIIRANNRADELANIGRKKNA